MDRAYATTKEEVKHSISSAKGEMISINLRFEAQFLRTQSISIISSCTLANWFFHSFSRLIILPPKCPNPSKATVLQNNPSLPASMFAIKKERLYIHSLIWAFISLHSSTNLFLPYHNLQILCLYCFICLSNTKIPNKARRQDDIPPILLRKWKQDSSLILRKLWQLSLSNATFFHFLETCQYAGLPIFPLPLP